MALDCVMQCVVNPISSFALNKVKGYVSYIRSYDDNIASLKEELEKLHVKKEDLKSKVSIGRKKLENITLNANIWLKKVSKLSQNEELKKLVVCEQRIAEKVLMLMELNDLKKVFIEGNERMIGVVIKVMMEHHDEDNNETDQEFKKNLKGHVLEVLKETTEKFKKMITEDIKVAMIMMTILKHEDVEKLSEGNEEKWKKMFEEESSEIHDDDESSTIADVVNLVRPFEKFLENVDFMKDLPEDMKLGVKMMDDLWKGRPAKFKDESAIEKHKDKYGHRHHCCYYFKHFHHRYEMSKLAEKMAKVIKPLCDNSPTSVTSQINIEDMEAIPSGFTVGVESREQRLQEILTKLQDEKVNCVGVYGMGGIGKTTLVKEVKSRAKGIFDKILLAAISESPNIERIQDQLAEGLDSPLVDVHSTGSRAQKLYNMLLPGNKEKKERDQGEKKGKIKILIILDNMWHKLNLSEVGIPFVTTNEFCCKILVTSRDKNVCEMMGIQADNIIELGLLNVNESKKLFQHHVNKTIDKGDYKSVAEKLLEKCNRLPLNITTTANMLKEKDFSTWQHFVAELEKPISSEVSSVRGETYKILETSYRFLESEEKKTFFLLACLSPLDSSISVDNLMRYGVGLDLFHNVNKLSEALEQAFKWVSELVSSSLLLKDDDSLSHVKIHDDVRVSAMSFAEKDDEQQHKFLVNEVPRWMSKERLNKYTAISLLSGAHDFSRLNAVKAELLQILLLKGNTSELADGFFQGMPNLKVLHLSYMTFKPQLPASIVELKNLKTLQLEHCELGDISLMCTLTELIVVSLRDSSLEELPAEMGKLVNLRILDMGRCRFKSLTNTKVIAWLSSLEGLYLFDKFSECASDNEFNELPHLNLLEVVYLLDQNNYNLIHLPLSRFFEHLDRFSIIFTKDDESLRRYTTSPLQHRALQFMGSANLLDIQASKDSSRIEALIKRTEYLFLDSTNLKKNLVPELDKDGFRDLKHLEVTSCKGLECVINTDIDGSNNLLAFQNLEYLKFGALGDLKTICKGNAPPGSRMFSNLRHLELNKCSNLEYALPLALLPKNLTEIKIMGCSGMKFIFNDNDYCPPSDGSEHNVNVVIDLPLLKLLYLGSSDLVSLVGPVAKADAFFNTKINCPSLELLRVTFLFTIECLWSKELDIFSFRNLKEMTILRCIGLQSLGSASVFCALVKLESMNVYSCEGLQTIITEETEEQKTIEFQQLRELELNCLHSLKSFYGGSYRVKFPKLKKLKMCELPKLIAFVGCEDPSTLFSDKVLGNSIYLKHLEVSECAGMECVINTDIDGSNNFIAFQNLEYLKLFSFDDLKMICKGNAPPGSRMFSNLRHLELYDCSNLEYALPLALLPKNLTEIKILDCSRMKFIFNDNDYCLPSDGSDHNENVVIDLPLLKLLSIGSRDLVSLVGPMAKADAFFNTKIKCPSLELLMVHSCSTIMNVFRSKEHDISDFRNLKEINIVDCNGLQSLGPISVFCALVQLQSLSVSSSTGLQTIITEETEEQKTIEFQQLRELELNCLDSLKSFYGGSYRVKFPKLKRLKMCDLPKLIAFVGSEDPSTLFSDKVEFRYLEELEVIGVIKDTNMQLWNWDGAVKDEDTPKLRKLYIDSIKGFRSIPNIISTNIYSLHLYDVGKTSEDKVLFSLSTSESQVVQLPNLEELYVESFPRLKTLFESEDNDGNSATAHENGMLARYCKLKQLTLEELPELSIIPYNSFKNLRFLYIQKLNWKYVFPIDVVARGLEMLEELTIKSCEKLDVVIMDDEKEGGDNDRVVRFPLLKTLYLEDLNIYSFSTRSYFTLDFSSLETLLINRCSKLEAFWSGPGPFISPKLKEICVFNCNYMKWFLFGELTQVIELLSLQKVQIDDAPCMKSFSATPLKAPKLREVYISSCEDMDWILPGYPNHNDVLDLPSLEILDIEYSKLQTFSTGPLKAPKLTQAMINGRNFDMGELEFEQFLEGYKPKKDNKDEGDKQESKHKSEEEIQENRCKEENHDKGNHEQI